MQHVSSRWSRSAEKEAFWRGHVGQQAVNGGSIRGYCREHRLSEPLFYAWRREIQYRDTEQGRPRRRLQKRPALPPSIPEGKRLAEKYEAASPRTPKPSVGSRAGSRGHSGVTGLIAVDIVGDATPLSTATPLSRTTSPAIEIDGPGGVVIRLREEVSTEVLQRVIVACERSRRVAATEATLANREVRSC